MGRKKNPTMGEVSLSLAEYDRLNSDLEKPIRRMLFMFAVANRCSVQVLEELFGRPLGQTPRRHRSFFWFNAIISSGLESHWQEFVDRKNSGIPMSDCLIRLRRRATEDQWLTLSRRVGCGIFTTSPRLNPHDYSHRETTMEFWTPGGNWSTRHNMTKIIVLGEHLPERDYHTKMLSNIHHSQLLKLEDEVHGFVDEQTLLVPDAQEAAITYVKGRLTEMVGRTLSVGMRSVSWFFQCAIPQGMKWHHYQHYNNSGYYRYTTAGRKFTNLWYPDE